MPNAIIVGAGLMGRQHARAAVRAGGRIVGVVDRDGDAAAALARGFAACVAGQSLDEVLGKTTVDVVHICTPGSTHMQLAGAVAEAGAHALIEKPVGRTAQELAQIADAFAAVDRMFCPVHQYAFQRAFDRARREAAGLGQLVRFECDIRSAGGPEEMGARDVTVADILPHPLSLMQRLCPGTKIDQLDWRLERSKPGEWLCAAPLADGALVKFSLSLTARPTCFTSRILTDGGEVDIDHFNGFATRVIGATSRAYKLLQPFDRHGRGLVAAATNLGRRIVQREWAYPGLAELAGAFYSAISPGGSGQPPVSVEAALAVARTRDFLLARAGTGDGGIHG